MICKNYFVTAVTLSMTEVLDLANGVKSSFCRHWSKGKYSKLTNDKSVAIAIEILKSRPNLSNMEPFRSPFLALSKPNPAIKPAC